MSEIDDLKISIERAEKLREQGETDQAKSKLTSVIRTAKAEGYTGALLSALGHRIICNKHLFQNTGEENFIIEMAEDCGEGLRTATTDEEKAVFYLRSGDTRLLLKQSKEAEEAYQRAYQCVPKGGHTEAEYLGHLAEAKAVNGKNNEALQLLDEAMSLMKRVQNVRPFHRLVIVSGLQARKVKTALQAKRYLSAAVPFLRGYSQAWYLKLRYGMPQRLNQFHKAIFSR